MCEPWHSPFENENNKILPFNEAMDLIRINIAPVRDAGANNWPYPFGF
jgi:hypothetical protein